MTKMEFIVDVMGRGVTWEQAIRFADIVEKRIGFKA